ncbi:MAG: hypothetical protein EOP04_20080 [Proteobacteria bacterium]|nr:MAG: hypothetical protein EOP04_20080 [Pseudomonadota bacterium]
MDEKIYPNFNRVLTWDCGLPRYGVFLEENGSIIESFGGIPRISHCEFQLTSINPLDSFRASFHDYLNKAIGVFDFKSAELVWSAPITKKSMDFLFFGNVQDSDSVAFQVKNSLTFLSVGTGEYLGTQLVSGRVRGIGAEWLVSQSARAVVVYFKNSQIEFSRKNGIGFVKQFGNNLVIIEFQGPARIICLRSRKNLFEIYPEPGSQFSEAYLREDGRLVLSQHYFDKPEKTFLNRLQGFSQLNSEIVEVASGGTYIFTNKGEEIAFSHRKIYNCSSGDQIGVF